MLRAVTSGRQDGERGAYAILFAILIVVLFIMTALAVDLSDARARVRDNQTRADSATLAAGSHLPGSPMAACRAAWTYLKTNTPDLPSGAGVTSPCDTVDFQALYGEGGQCDPAVSYEYEAIGTEPYKVVFTYPVTDAVLASNFSASDRGAVPDYDGEPCERFGVSFIKSQGALFGGIVGGTGIQAPAMSVVRGFQGDDVNQTVALLILDPNGCNALRVTGTGGVKVYAHPEGNVGRITMDSNADKLENPNRCGNNIYALDASNNGQAEVWACGNTFDGDPDRCDVGGIIEHFGYDPSQITCLPSTQNNACDPADLSQGLLKPTPVRSVRRPTRSPADHEWNCKAAYPDYEPYPGQFPPIPIRPCGQSTPAYIDQLRGLIGDTGTSAPAGFTTINNCSPASGTVFAPGNYYVNCTGNTKFSINGDVTFEGGNVVFGGDVGMTGGHLRINTNNPAVDIPTTCRRPEPLTAACVTQSSQKASFVYFRNGGKFDRTSNALITMSHVFVYMDSSDPRGGTGAKKLDLGGGTGALVWTAPIQFGSPVADDPDTLDVDESTPGWFFDKLALWSENSRDHRLGATGTLDVRGVFFTPSALFDYNGQATQLLDRAQFLTFRMDSSGQGELRMQPDPKFVIQIPVQGWYLIR